MCTTSSRSTRALVAAVRGSRGSSSSSSTSTRYNTDIPGIPSTRRKCRRVQNLTDRNHIKFQCPWLGCRSVMRPGAANSRTVDLGTWLVYRLPLALQHTSPGEGQRDRAVYIVRRNTKLKLRYRIGVLLGIEKKHRSSTSAMPSLTPPPSTASIT